MRFLICLTLGLAACASSSQPAETAAIEPAAIETAVSDDCVVASTSFVMVPDVVGLSLPVALITVRDAGLTVVGTGTLRADPVGELAVVRSQEPPAGVEVPVGACIGFRTTVGDVVDGVRRIDGLENVDTSLYALGSVWAATSNRPDRYSPDELLAHVVRIDPATGRSELVLASPDFEPTLSELDDKVWVQLVDRIVALDAAGAEVMSIDFDPGALGDHVAGLEHLWVLNRADGMVSAIDPRTATIIRSIATGDFPAGLISAFGHVWIPSLTDGTVTIIDEETFGDTTLVTAFVDPVQLKAATAVPDGVTGDEVWVTNTAGDLFAITAGGNGFGQVRQLDIESEVNRVHVLGAYVFLLPIRGRSVIVLDRETEEFVTRIFTESIPFKAVVSHGRLWVVGDGMEEIVTVIDPESLTVTDQFSVGTNASNTNGPQQPFVVGEEIWIPNRGDDAFFILSTHDR